MITGIGADPLPRATRQADCPVLRAAPGYAHKDPDLRNTRRTQGRNQALVCGPVLPNSFPCVRHQGERMLKTDGSGPVAHDAERRRRELRTTNTDEHAMAAEANMGESSPAMASGTIATL